jgi:hypothetical protein
LIVAIRRSLAVVVLLVVAGCSTAAPSASPSPSPSADASVAVTGSASAAPSLTASQASASTPPASAPPVTPGPSAAGCQALPQTVALPSDRFTDIKVEPGADADRLIFAFGNASLPGPPTPPQGSLELARLPYTQAANGKSITIAGDHVVQVRFTGMSLANDVGQPTYGGRTDIRAAGTAFKQAVLFDASEGTIGWYVGHDGSGCIALVVGGHDVTLVIAHG